MFAKNDASNIKEYLEKIPEDRKKVVTFLHDFIQQSAPKLKPFFAFNMLGYGSFQYLDKRTKELKNWPVVALANQKNYVSIYVCALEGGEYVAEKYKSKLGKVNVGKSCIRLKKLEDINLDTLKKVIKIGESSPGLVGAESVRK